MEKVELIKKQILELHKKWDAISDDDDSFDGLKDAECIESDVQDLIISYCEEKKYTIGCLTIEKLKSLYEDDDDDLSPYERWEQILDKLVLTHDDVAKLLWFYYHTFWPEEELWRDVGVYKAKLS